MVVAAGHAAGYALALGPGAWTRIALIAPTWRGPLPTMMGGYRPLQTRVRRAIELPVIGPALYRLNIMRPVIGMMYRRHVYADAARVTPAFVADKTRIASRPGGRFGTAAFVTGGLDLIRDRAGFLAAPHAASAQILLIYGADTPPRSRAEMQALSTLPCVISKCLPAGSLGLHEEYPDRVAQWLAPFLRGVPRTLGTPAAGS
jgi:hypothetical protein